MPNDNDLCPESGATPHLEARQFTGTIDRTWGIASFTRLISGRDADVLDEGPLVEATAGRLRLVDAESIHAFPRGMRAGTCLHEILEEIDFANLARRRSSCSAGCTPTGSTASTQR